MPKLTIDGKEIEVQEGMTIMQACMQMNKEIPHFCYHERLNIAGNCRMCLVEMEKAPKPVASCSITAADGMVIKTNSKKVIDARKGVMQFLLINHPLDCPVCDQGGECDLQDQAFKYGAGDSIYQENKRAVDNKDISPLIKTHMTRCIHCTRCIRFTDEIAGTSELGAKGRGEDMEIDTYLNDNLKSELSSNIIDLCPVGALTAKPYANKARSWELTSYNSIDTTDALGANIRVDSYNDEIFRILPRINNKINHEWISDKARFCYDGLLTQRLDSAYIKKDDKLSPCSLEEALNYIKKNLDKTKSFRALAGKLASVESMFLLKSLANQLNSDDLHSATSLEFNLDFDKLTQKDYQFNITPDQINKTDLILLIGANVRQISPILSSFLGQNIRNQKAKAFQIGSNINQYYDIETISEDLSILPELLNNKHKFCKILKQAKHPLFIVGDAVLSRNDANEIFNLLQIIAKKFNVIADNNDKQNHWHGLNILHHHASSIGSLNLNFHNYSKKLKLKKATSDVTFLLNFDEIDNINLKDSFVIYQGHHGDKGASIADVILPAASPFEEEAYYINMFGNIQSTNISLNINKNILSNIKLLLKIAKTLNINLLPNLQAENSLELNDVRSYIRNIISKDTEISKTIPSNKLNNEEIQNICSKINLSKKVINKEIDFYQYDIISKYSKILAKCKDRK